jgi:FkbM family methyltransferase
MMLMKVLALLPALSQGLPNDCPKPSTELKLNSIIAGLFREDNMPRGSIIDVGALDGTFACFYARLASTRIVHALDPTPSNVEKFQRRYAHIFPNIQPMIAALGETRGSLSVNALPKIRNGAFMQLTNVHDAVEPQHDTGVPVYPADELFRTTWRGENLGFAHVDVEGSELSVLRGMEQRIRSDKPVFTVEVHVHFQPDFTLEMLGFINRLDYDVFLVEETCGEAELAATPGVPYSLHVAASLASCRNAYGLPKLDLLPTRPKLSVGYFGPCYVLQSSCPR